MCQLITLVLFPVIDTKVDVGFPGLADYDHSPSIGLDYLVNRSKIGKRHC